MKIKLFHETESMNKVFGISKKRSNEITKAMTMVDDSFDFDKKSERLEEYYTIAKNYKEALFITFLVGSSIRKSKGSLEGIGVKVGSIDDLMELIKMLMR